MSRRRNAAGWAGNVGSRGTEPASLRGSLPAQRQQRPSARRFNSLASGNRRPAESLPIPAQAPPAPLSVAPAAFRQWRFHSRRTRHSCRIPGLSSETGQRFAPGSGLGWIRRQRRSFCRNSSVQGAGRARRPIPRGNWGPPLHSRIASSYSPNHRKDHCVPAFLDASSGSARRVGRARL